MQPSVAVPDPRLFRPLRTAGLLCLAALLAACGTKGALRLPPGPPPAPLLGQQAMPAKAVANAPAPAGQSPAALPAAGDTSMSKDSSR